LNSETDQLKNRLFSEAVRADVYVWLPNSALIIMEVFSYVNYDQYVN
jgi:hypothetical protein